MSRLKHYHWFWMLSVVFLMLTIYYRVNTDCSAANFVSDGSYFVIPDAAATKIFTVLFCFVGFIYWLFFYFKIVLNPVLSKIHRVITIGIVFVYVIGTFVVESGLKGNFPVFQNPPDLNLFIVVMVLLVLAIQIIFIMNIILSLVTHFQSKNRKLN